MPLHVYYDTRLAPTTFDFTVFLVGSDAYRQSIGVTSSYIYIVAPEFRMTSKRDKTTEKDEKRWRVNHILAPLPSLIPSTLRVTVQMDVFNQISYPVYPPSYPPLSGQPASIPYTPDILLKFYDAGFDIQPLRACEHGKLLVRNITLGHNYYTITLRTTRFQSERNSTLDHWYRVYKELTSLGLKVWVIPDIEDVFGDKRAFRYDWQIADFAIYDLRLRMALYEDAEDNLFVSNGIGAILTFSKCPFKMFKVCNESFSSTDTEYFERYWQIKPGESPRFFGNHQTWNWVDDEPESILKTVVR